MRSNTGWNGSEWSSPASYASLLAELLKLGQCDDLLMELEEAETLAAAVEDPYLVHAPEVPAGQQPSAQVPVAAESPLGQVLLAFCLFSV